MWISRVYIHGQLIAEYPDTYTWYSGEWVHIFPKGTTSDQRRETDDYALFEARRNQPDLVVITMKQEEPRDNRSD